MSTKDLQIARVNISIEPFNLLKRRSDKKSFNKVSYPVNPLASRSPEILPK